MKDFFTVAEFTVKETIRRKSFSISMLIIIVIIVIGFNIPNIVNHFSNGSSEKEKILIVDSDNIFEDTIINIGNEDSSYEYTISKDSISQDDIKKKLKNDEFDSCLVFKKENQKIQIDYIVESLMIGQTIPQDLIENFSIQYTAVQIKKAGLTQEQLESMFTQFDINTIQIDENAAKGNSIVPMLLSIVLFYAIYFCAYQVSTSITTEKTSKIMETLVTSTSPKQIVLGKTVGIGFVGICQVAIITMTAVFSAKTFLPVESIKNVFDLSAINAQFIIATIVYFLLGYFMYALLYALTGSMVSKPEDIQSANGPVAILAVIGFYLSYFTMMNPASELNVFASMFPISSPFCMPFRVMMGLAKPTDVIISIVILLITGIIIAKIAIKIYSNAILNYGTKMSFYDIVKMYKD